jgi:hypothetical protein
LQVLGVKAKLRAFVYGILAIAFEVALLYPAKLIDDQIDFQVRLHFGEVPAWIDWTIHALFWLSVIIGPIAAYLVGSHFLDRWWRKARFKASLAEAASTSVRIAGTERWTDFHADQVLALAVPDAVAAIDNKRRLLRLKAIGSPQDAAVEFVHIIGVEWRPGETRAAQGRQSLFRRFNPKYRTLAEYPAVRLEIATKGREPVLEYFLLVEPRDRKALQRCYAALERGTRVEHFVRPVPTEILLDILPLQGSRYGFDWIKTEAGT